MEDPTSSDQRLVLVSTVQIWPQQRAQSSRLSNTDLVQYVQLHYCAFETELIPTLFLFTPAWIPATYALVPVTSGAWAEGRFGTVAVAALLPWAAHAALGFVDPDRDRRWRASD